MNGKKKVAAQNKKLSKGGNVKLRNEKHSIWNEKNHWVRSIAEWKCQMKESVSLKVYQWKWSHLDNREKILRSQQNLRLPWGNIKVYHSNYWSTRKIEEWDLQKKIFEEICLRIPKWDERHELTVSRRSVTPKQKKLKENYP